MPLLPLIFASDRCLLMSCELPNSADAGRFSPVDIAGTDCLDGRLRIWIVKVNWYCPKLRGREGVAKVVKLGAIEATKCDASDKSSKMSGLAQS